MTLEIGTLLVILLTRCLTEVLTNKATAVPHGCQTHMMVYGPGGDKSPDFLKVAIPLNIICRVVSCLLISYI